MKRGSRKLVWIMLIGIVIIVFFTFISIFIQTTIKPTKLDISSWQVCRNDEYGFEFRYPKGWIVQNIGNPGDRRQVDCNEILSVPGYTFIGENNGMSLRIKNEETQDIWHEDFSNITSLDDYLKKVKNRDSDQLHWAFRLIRVGGMETLGGEKLYWKGLGNGNLFGVWGGKGKLLITYHNENIYEFRTSIDKDILDNILLSFKFLD